MQVLPEDSNRTDAPAAAPAAIPVGFGVGQKRCFGWLHPPRSPMRPIGVVLCRPIGFEGASTYETYTVLAEQLAQAGIASVRFDYHGTGDSAGGDSDPDRVKAWLDSISGAAELLRQRAGVAWLALFGVRIGATLAAYAAAQIGGVERLVMWAPCVSGRSFVRELRLSGSANADGLEALGHHYTAQTLSDLQALDCQKLEPAPAQQILLIERDDLSPVGALPEHFRRLGAACQQTTLPGFARMMAEPHETRVPHAALDAIVAWLSPTEESNNIADSADIDWVEAAWDNVFSGVRETPLLFGTEQKLFGILASAQDVAAAGARAQTAILMLNVGTNHRVGPNRLYVKMARAWAAHGYRTLRFDLAGMGDSRAAAGYASERLYAIDSTRDVQAAMDALNRLGCTRFILMGLCSGAYVAFQTARLDPRVTGLVLLNPRRLAWNPGETLQSAMQVSYKSSHFYRRALLDPTVYRRLLRGEVDWRGILARLWTLLLARVKRGLTRLLGAPAPQDDVLTHARALSARGTQILMLIGADDDGRDYIEFHFGHQGRKMRDCANFELRFIEGSDHTFSKAASQQHVIALVQAHLDGLQANLLTQTA